MRTMLRAAFVHECLLTTGSDGLLVLIWMIFQQ